MKAKVTMNQNWDKVKKASWLDSGLLEMSTDIDRRAKALAPVETSALRNSGKVSPIANGYKVSFGSSRVPYARIRHEVNNKNPHTRRYLVRAGDSVVRGNTAKYFRSKI